MDKKVENGIEHKVNISKSKLDCGYGWIIVFTAFIIQFIGDGVAYTFGLFFVEISKDYPEIGKSGTSIIISICVAMTHGIVKRYGSRVVSILGGLMASFGYAMSYFATNALTLYLTIGIFGGIGFGFLYLPANVSVPQYFDKKLAFAMGIAVTGSGCGTFFFDWTISLILANFGWKQGFLITSGIIAITIPFSFLYRPIKETQDQVKVQDKSPEKNRKWMEDWNGLDLNLLQNILFLLFAISDLLMSLGINTPFVYLPEIEQKLTRSSSSSSLLYFISGMNVLSRLMFSYLCDKVLINRRILYMSASMIAGTATILSPHCTTLTLLQMYAATYGVCMGICVSFKSVILVDLLGLRLYTDAFGLLLCFQAVGLFVGTPFVGYLYDYFGTYVYGFYFSGLTIFSSGLVITLIPLVVKTKVNVNTNFESK